MHFFTFFFRSLFILLSFSLLDKAHGQALPLRYTDAYRGNFLLIGNTLAQDAGPGIPAPLVGTVGAAGSNTSDSAPDVFWRSDSPSSGEAEANTSITAANARSAAILTIPVGAVVKKAYLYWGAGLLANSTTIQPTANLQIGTATPINLQADAFTQRVASQQLAYQAVKDITELVQANGSEKYTVSGVQSPPLRNVSDNVGFVAWSMVVFYESSSEPYRSLALNDGLAYIQSGQPYSATYSDLGLINGSVKLGIVAYEGDGVTFGGGIGDGDGLYINGAAQSNALNPADNFFNNTRSTDGVAVSVVGDLPQLTGGVGSMSGIDLDILDITGSVVQGASSYAVRTTSNGDAYFIGVLASSTEAILPTPTISNLGANADPVCSGSPVTFTATIGNITGPYDFTLTNGGIGQSTGTTSGTAFSQSIEATGSGVQSVTLIISDNGQSTLAITSITVNELPLVSNPLVTSSSIGTAFNQSFTSSGGQNPYTYSLASGSPPEGVTLATTGLLSGTPTQIGNFSLTVQATDSRGCVGVSTPYYLTVNEAAGPIRYVKPQASGSGDGSSWSNASSNLQAMINATGVQQVWVAAGTYKPTTNTDRSISFSLKNGVAVYGGFTGSETSLSQRPAINPVSGQPSSSTLSGDIGTTGVSSDNSYHVLYQSAGQNNTAVLDGFIITAGNADGIFVHQAYGGGMYNTESNPTINKCSFQDNSARNGGGMANDDSSPVLINCSFQNNIGSENGGGMLNTTNANPRLTNCNFLSNSTPTYGGGMYNNANCNPTLTNCSFQGNSARYGGAITLFSSSPTLINCSFQNNSASSSGGGIQCNDSSPALTNCSFQNNSATYGGGGINNDGWNTSATLTNCSFQGNSVSQNSGAAIFNATYVRVYLTNCILFGNGGDKAIDNAGGSVNLFNSLIESSVTDIVDGGGNQRTRINPFVSTSSTQLHGCSTAINAGTNSATGLSDITTDLAGNPRFYNGGTVDMGAYEYQGDPITVTVTNPMVATATVGQPFSQSFAASGGISPYSFSVVSGSLPSGLSLATTGELSGTPAQSGSFTIHVQAREVNGCVGTSGAYSLRAIAAVPTLSGFAATSSTVCVGSPVTFTATIGNVTGSYTYTLTNGGTPTTGNTTNPSLSLTQTANGSGVQSFTLIIRSMGESTLATTNVTVNSFPPAALSNNGPLSCTLINVTLTASGGISYTFVNSSGSVVAGSGNTRTVSSPDTYSVTVANASGCVSTTTTTVTSTTATITVTNPTTTSGIQGVAFNQTFTASGGEAPRSFSLASGSLPMGLSLSTSGVLSGTPTQNGSFTITVRATDANGCSGISASYRLIVVDPSPTISNLLANPDPLCQGSQVTFTASIGNVTGNYSFTLTNGLVGSPTGTTIGTANGSSFSQVMRANDAGFLSYTLTISSQGQTASETYLLSVAELPSVSLMTPDGSELTCSKPTLPVMAQGGDQYVFSGPGIVRQEVVEDREQWIGMAEVNQAGVYSVTVSNGEIGCSSVASFTITEDTSLPSVSISPSSATLTCANPSVTLTATGTGSYLWSTGATSQTITAASAGTYSVTLTGSNGCSATASVGVSTEQNAPQISISPSSATLTCASPTASLTAIGTGTVLWSTGSTDRIINVASAGTYSVTLTASGGCTAVNSVSISQDNTAPLVSIGASTTTLTCANPSVTLTAIGTGTYLWSTGATSQTITATAAGTYSVTLTSSNGCTNTSFISVTANQAPPALSLTASSTLLTCATPSLTLTALGTGTFRWSTGSTAPQITVSTDGTYSVTLTAPSGCTATSSVLIEQDNSGPTVSISPTSATLSCTNPTVTLTANGSGTYRWNTGATSQTITASSAGTYSVTLTADNSCLATASRTLEQGADQTIAFTQQPASASSITVGNTVTTQVSVSGQPTSYQWYKGSISNPLPSQTTAQLTLTNVQLSDAGSYFVLVSGPCNSLTSTAFSLGVTNPVTVLTLTASASPNPIQAGQSATLTATVSGGTNPYSYSFAGLGTIIPSTNTATVSGLAAGVYSFTVTASDATQPTPRLASSVVSLTVTAVETAPFAITGVTTISCSPITPNRFSVSFTPRYSGLTGQPVSFSVANELLPTTQVGPYTIQLYTDNATITLQAAQQGTPMPTSFSYNWLEACRTSETPNTPPRVVNTLPNQTAKIGDYFTYVIPEATFTDSETPLSLRLSASGLPAGLSFSGATLSGTPSTTVGSPFTVRITATDPGGLSVSTPLVISVLPATGPVDPTAPFAITGVTTISCTPIANRINISFAPQYAGLNGQPIAFEVVNERAPTTDPAPYSLTLYRDNPVITLRARQTGSEAVASFAYNWLAACSTSGQDNTPPRVNSPVGSQTATVGKSFNLNLANTFADQETPGQVSLSASGLPAGLVLVGTAISGTPSVSGVATVMLTATDGGGLSTQTSFALTVNPAGSTTVTPPSGFAITGVQTLSCVTVSAGLRSITFQPQYVGVNGQPISFRVENELAATTASGPYILNLYMDNPNITLKATQVGSDGEVSYSYNWLAACSAPARLGSGEPTAGLQVTVLGNPVEGEQVEVEIRGVSGQGVTVQLVDQQGKSVSQQHIEQACLVERLHMPVGTTRGILLLSVQTVRQQHQQKIVVK